MLNVRIVTLSVLGLIVATCSLAQSAGTSHQEPDKTQEVGTKNNPVVVEVLPPGDAAERARAEKEDRDAKRKTDDELSRYTGQLAAYTEDLAAYTLVLAALGGGQILIIIAQVVLVWRQEAATKTIERAYVKMSHTDPGLIWFDVGGDFLLEMKVENFGNTPADVTDVLLRPIVLDAAETLPRSPPYERQGTEESFHTCLVKRDYFLYRRPEPLTTSCHDDIIAGRKVLYVFGYVDYVDKFGQRHRSGYARRYIPYATSQAGGNNLAFVSQPGYNYDRPV